MNKLSATNKIKIAFRALDGTAAWHFFLDTETEDEVKQSALSAVVSQVAALDAACSGRGRPALQGRLLHLQNQVRGLTRHCGADSQPMRSEVAKLRGSW
jgi:hypothetical protein